MAFDFREIMSRQRFTLVDDDGNEILESKKAFDQEKHDKELQELLIQNEEICSTLQKIGERVGSIRADYKRIEEEALIALDKAKDLSKKMLDWNERKKSHRLKLEAELKAKETESTLKALEEGEDL